VLDCPLSSLLESLLGGCASKPADIFEDRTFKWDGPQGPNNVNNSTVNTSSTRTDSGPQNSQSPEPKSEESDGVHGRLIQRTRYLDFSMSFKDCCVHLL